MTLRVRWVDGPPARDLAIRLACDPDAWAEDPRDLEVVREALIVEVDK